ncbi:MAG: peptide-methionine (S)-S-oxide reductase MsrA [Amphiplicatus sp.]
MKRFRMPARLRVVFALIFGAAALWAAPSAPQEPAPATAVFAGGCFWCVEADFEKLPGVSGAVSGYSGDDLQNPTYRNHGRHLEAVRVEYDPSVIAYRTLVDYFLRHIDPLDDGGQFCDRGHSYTTAIFVQGPDERAAAAAAIAEAEQKLGEKIVTPVRERLRFWDAEDYHQDYYKKNKAQYGYYRSSCGRDRRIKQVWGE